MQVFLNQDGNRSYVPSITVINLTNKLFADAVDYRGYSLIKRSCPYDNDMTIYVSMMIKTVVLEENWTFYGNN